MKAVVVTDLQPQPCDRCGVITRAYSAIWFQGGTVVLLCPFCKGGEG